MTSAAGTQCELCVLVEKNPTKYLCVSGRKFWKTNWSCWDVHCAGGSGRFLVADFELSTNESEWGPGARGDKDHPPRAGLPPLAHALVPRAAGPGRGCQGRAPQGIGCGEGPPWWGPSAHRMIVTPPPSWDDEASRGWRVRWGARRVRAVKGPGGGSRPSRRV